ncbi:hypothetical protein D3C76_1391080 [compost metagenome]
MRQRHAPERQPLLRAADYAIGETVAPADHKHDMARPVRAELVQRPGELLRAPQLTAYLQSDDMGIALHMCQNALTFAHSHLCDLRLAHRLGRLLVGDLDDLKFYIWRKPLCIFCDSLHQILFLQFSNGNNLNKHICTPLSLNSSLDLSLN